MITTITNPETGKREFAVTLKDCETLQELYDLKGALLDSVRTIANDRDNCGRSTHLYLLSLILESFELSEKHLDTIENLLFIPQPQQL
ncbi:MAG: hypothetical protein SNJ35_08350 [Rikenellaceae bacterium]